MSMLKAYSLKEIIEMKTPFKKEIGNWIFDEKTLYLENHKYSSSPYLISLSRVTTKRELLDWILHLNEKGGSLIDVSGFIELLERISYEYFNENLFCLMVLGNKKINWKTKTIEEENTFN